MNVIENDVITVQDDGTDGNEPSMEFEVLRIDGDRLFIIGADRSTSIVEISTDQIESIFDADGIQHFIS